MPGAPARTLAISALKKSGVRFLPVAFLIGALPYGLAQVAFWIFRLGALDADQSVKHFTFVLLLNPIITALLGALGEEIGWRGFLQPALETIYSPRVSYLLVGIIWAYWHIPANLGGANGAEHAALNTFAIFPATVIFISMAFGWLRGRSQSIWPCAYLHGVVNSVSNSWIVKPNTELSEKLTVLAAWVLIGFMLLCLNRRTAASDDVK